MSRKCGDTWGIPFGMRWAGDAAEVLWFMICFVYNLTNWLISVVEVS